MIPPTSQGTLVSSKSILRSAARRLQPAKRGDDNGDGTCDSWVEKACDVVYKIWCSVGLVVERSLLSAARGVRIESLGTFALDAKGRTRFFLAAEFAARHRLLKYDVAGGGMLAGGSVNTRLNVARVAATAGSARPDAERVVEAVLRSLHQRLASGKSVVLAFHNVAEFTCTPHGEATMKFLGSFRRKQKTMAVDATRARTGMARIRTSPTPWASKLGPNALTATGSAGQARRKAACSSPRVTTVRDSDRHAPGARQGEPLVERPRPATSCSVRTARPSHLGNSGRPETSHHFGVAERSSPSENRSSTSCDTSLVASSVGHTDATESPEDESSGKTNGFRSHHTDSSAHRLTSSTSSRFSSSRSARSQRDSYQLKASGGGHSENDDGNGATTFAEQHTSRKNPDNARAQQPSRHTSQPGRGTEMKSKGEEERLSGLLSRQTLAQAGEEGLRRLVETLRLTSVSASKVGEINSNSGEGGHGRVSGRDLLLALRDVGTTLTSAELAETTRVFQRQPDGCVSLPALLGGIRTDYGAKELLANDAYGDIGGKDERLSYMGEEDKGGETAAVFRSAAPSAAFVGRAPFCVASETPAQEKAEWSRAPAPPTHHDEEGGRGDTSLSTPRLSESSTVARVLRMERQGSGSREKGIVDTSPVGSRSVNAASTTQASVVTSVARPQQDRRQCWVDENDDRGGNGDGYSRTVGVSPGDPIADLAGIVFDPPSSLERLLHVLQASKVSEQPTMSSAALGARLCQLRPRLGKAKAKQLAAAVCRYPEKQVYLEQLHALLERRFGRRRTGSSTPRGESAAAVSGTIARNSVSSRNGGEIIRASSSILTTEAKGSTVSPAASSSSSCAAVGRIRQKLLTSKQGLRGLRTALFSVGCRSGRGGGGGGGDGDERGSLNKDELRRALTIAGGTDATPPTTKDMDDLFTLLSSQSSGGVRGGRVDAATILCAIRGKLSPFREKVVRNVFHEIFGPSGNKNSGTRTGTDRISGDNAGLGECCSSIGLGPGGEGGRNSSRAGDGNKLDTAGGRAPPRGVSIEQFLEYYRDVSAGIDGDDDFEAAVRASWPQQRRTARFDRGDGGSTGASTKAIEHQGRPGAAKEAMSPSPSRRGANGRGGKKEDEIPAASSSVNQSRSRTTEDLRSSGSGSIGNGGPPPRQRKEGKSSSSPEKKSKSKSAREQASSRQAAAAAAAPSASDPSARGATTKRRQSAAPGGMSITKDRNAAAVRVQAVFRGHKGRACAAGENRKRARRLAADREAEEEHRRPRAAASRRQGGRILRPKVASTYGF